MRHAGRVILVVLPLAVLAACSERPGPTVVGPDAQAPNEAISDAVHDDGNDRFYWLPPMVGAAGGFENPFDGTQDPEVLVCALAECPTPLAVYTTTSGVGGVVVQVSAEDEHYSVALHTDEAGLSPGTVYRVSVLVAGTELGFADITLAATGKEAKNLSTGELIGLKDGRTLPVQFRIEQGAVFPIPSSGGSLSALGGAVTMVFPDGALDEETGITVQALEPTDGAFVAYDFGPDGIMFDVDVLITIAYLESSLGGIDETDLALVVRDAQDRWIVKPGSQTFPALNHVSAPYSHFSGGGVGLAALAIYCPGDADTDTFDLLADAIAAVMPGGTVEVCPGTHTVIALQVTKEVTIQGAPVPATDPLPTLTTAGGRAGLILNGSVTVRDLRMVLDYDSLPVNPDAAALVIDDAHDQVLVEDVEIDVVSVGVGALISQSSVAGAQATLNRAAVTGGYYGARVLVADTAGEDSPIDISNTELAGQIVAIQVEAFGASASRVTLDSLVVSGPDSALAVRATNLGTGTGPRVDVLDSSLEGAVAYFGGASGVIQNNAIGVCTFQYCIRVFGNTVTGGSQPEPVRILGNQIPLATASATGRGIWLTNASSGPFEVNGNQLTGVDVSGADRTDPLVYSYRIAGIRVEDPFVAGELNANAISSANAGISADSAFAVTGLDNVITAVRVGILAEFAGVANIHSSDVTDYLVPIGPGATYSIGALTCNYWGAATGPIGVDPIIGSSLYTPFATASVAGTSTTVCSGGVP
jgi:hypothetical protein